MIAAALREGDLAVAWGPDRALVLLPMTGAGAAARVVARLRRRIETGRRSPEGSALRAGITSVPPAAELDPTAAAAERALEAAASDPAPAGPPPLPRIRLVEDDAVTAALIRDRLRREGHEVEQIAHGGEALERLCTDPPDLTLLDVQLPGLDAAEILRELRRRGPREHPVLLLTAIDPAGGAPRGLELGADDYLVKPFSPAELVLRVERLLSARV